MSRTCRIMVMALGLSSACVSDRERREREELRQLSVYVDRLREADNADKAPLLGLLERQSCTAAAACELQALCVEAYRVHQRALDGIAALAQLAAGDAGSVDVRSRFAAAETELQRALERTRACADARGRLEPLP